MRTIAIVLAAAALAGCGGRGSPAPSARTSSEGPNRPAPPAPEPAPAPARCPAGVANCHSADGRILYVERVDPDGDGDAHFVLVSDESVTAPGITVVDVRRDLRPHPLPVPGDRISAAGPVYRGSYGQRQIQADVIHVGPSGGR
ncbi:MAG TPA: hypothetical protein VKA89_11995 [Solirubrobacterales bacterium]|nr:hypothetical protein [Solirubrobacterales bacterium]